MQHIITWVMSLSLDITPPESCILSLHVDPPAVRPQTDHSLTTEDPHRFGMLRRRGGRLTGRVREWAWNWPLWCSWWPREIISEILVGPQPTETWHGWNWQLCDDGSVNDIVMLSSEEKWRIRQQEATHLALYMYWEEQLAEKVGTRRVEGKRGGEDDLDYWVGCSRRGQERSADDWRRKAKGVVGDDSTRKVTNNNQESIQCSGRKPDSSLIHWEKQKENLLTTTVYIHFNKKR